MLQPRFCDHSLGPLLMGLGCAVGVGACAAPQEAQHVELAVETDASQLGPVTTNLGYSVELTEARIMVRDLTFATGGDLLTRSFVERTYDWLIPTAQAHPGHFEGGDVTGELPGALLLDFLPGEEQTLGTATFLAGDYRSANMTFCRAASSDLENKDDPLLGHTALFRGTAKSDDKTVEFFVLVAIEDGTALMGIPFEAHIDGSTGHSLGVQLRALDEIEGDTLFDDVDFALLDDNHDGHITISPEQTSKTATEAHSTLSRALLVHDFYAIKLAK